jgi:hypothetical protein
MQTNTGVHRGHLQLIISLGLVGILVSILSGYAYYGMFSPAFSNNQYDVAQNNLSRALVNE